MCLLNIGRRLLVPFKLVGEQDRQHFSDVQNSFLTCIVIYIVVIIMVESCTHFSQYSCGCRPAGHYLMVLDDTFYVLLCKLAWSSSW